jgi:hypothetical protein
LNALSRLLAVGSEWGSYATLVPTGGACKAARAAADEASEHLGRQGARQAARQLDDEWVRLYRAVSPEEVDDIVKSGMFRPTVGSLEGKWFTTTPELAARWGKRLWEMSQSLGNRPKPFTIIEAAIPKWLRRIERPRHDGIGPAIYIDDPELQHIRFVRELEAVPWIR